MALTKEQTQELLVRLVQRANDENNFVNTINLADRIEVQFVWYPGENTVFNSIINVLLPIPKPGTKPMEVPYTWTRQGMSDIKRTMASGRITLPLAPGKTGVLTVFDTQWQILRVAAGTIMTAVDRDFGKLRRLNLLGYHLREPGALREFDYAFFGWKGERAVLAFQVDYRQPPSTRGPASPLHVRGEWRSNPGLQVLFDVENDVPAGGPPSPNPSAADATDLGAALAAVLGM